MIPTLEAAFVLHRRPYRETSLILELLTQDHGRIAVLARGVRKVRSRLAALLQPFTPLLLSWQGKGELYYLNQAEANGYRRALVGKNLRCGFYLNELLMRLLPKQDAHPSIFALYEQTLADLQNAALGPDPLLCEKALRLFEKRLLLEIGYGLPLQAQPGFKNEERYHFNPEEGFLPYSATEPKSAILRHSGVFSGKALNALLSENFEDKLCLQEVKRLMRFILATLLGRPLESRGLFEYQLEMED